MHCDVQHMHLDGALTRGKDQNVFLSLLTKVSLYVLFFCYREGICREQFVNISDDQTSQNQYVLDLTERNTSLNLPLLVL